MHYRAWYVTVLLFLAICYLPFTTPAPSAERVACGLQSTMEECLETTQSELNCCGPNATACLCDVYKAIASYGPSRRLKVNDFLTSKRCYNSCPNDPKSLEALHNETIHCDPLRVKYGAEDIQPTEELDGNNLRAFARPEPNHSKQRGLKGLEMALDISCQRKLLSSYRI
ncbi:hypothetical protein NA57DRAFT_58350 [Rhizodiscina lignyota]|uniref:Extracellular membrane protein CFEM domain-containing protein n=1 Tax=Rhizodiscina lignyota TaxID=1504668 RepID=A0A9P4IBW8_9PEZI|nr:hypothetical protein NA57DRAFT_58350 [Rhizodiscina lignyota]